LDRKEAGSKGKDHGKEKGSLERKREAWKEKRGSLECKWEGWIRKGNIGREGEG